MDGWMDVCMRRWMDGGRWMDWWVGGWAGGWTDGRMDESVMYMFTCQIVCLFFHHVIYCVETHLLWPFTNRFKAPWAWVLSQSRGNAKPWKPQAQPRTVIVIQNGTHKTTPKSPRPCWN